MGEKKKVVRDEVKLYGEMKGEEACGNCIDADNYINTKRIPEAKIPVVYQHFSVYNDEEGKKAAEEYKIKEIPFIEACAIAEDGAKKCDKIIGNDEKKLSVIGQEREIEF